MFMINFDAESRTIDVSTMLERPFAYETSHWKFGEKRRNGKSHETNGFSACLPDADSWSEAVSLMKGFWKSHEGLLSQLASAGAQKEFRLGVFVGSEKSFAPSLSFPVELMSELSALGIAVTVSCYPTNDET